MNAHAISSQVPKADADAAVEEFKARPGRTSVPAMFAVSCEGQEGDRERQGLEGRSAA